MSDERDTFELQVKDGDPSGVQLTIQDADRFCNEPECPLHATTILLDDLLEVFLMSPSLTYSIFSGGLPIRPSMLRWPVFRHYSVKRKSEKNVLLKHVLHSFINSKYSLFQFLCSRFLSLIKQHKLVQYIVWIGSIFSSHCITVRPAIYLCI